MGKCDNFVTYRVTCEKGNFHFLHGLKGDRKGYYYKWISYNKFEDEMSKIPEGALLMNKPKWLIEEYYCGSKKVFVPNQHLEYKGYKYVITMDNGGSPFCVFYKEGDVTVFRMDPKYIIEDWELDHRFYTKKVAHFSPREIMLGKAIKNKSSEFSGGYGKWADGNTILLWIGDDEYVYIGESIFSFRSLSKIIKYNSPIGNSDVPYPYAVDEDGRYYLMIANVMIENIPRGYKKDPYHYYYETTRDVNYNPEPGKYYDKMIDSWKENNKIYKEVDGKIKYVGRREFKTTREEYVKRSKSFGKEMGFSKLKNKKIIVKRIMGPDFS